MKHTELRVKQGVTTITRVFVYLIAAGVFSVCALLLPEIAREEARSNPHAGPVLPYFLGAWILSIPVFIALYETHKLLGYIDENKAFSALSIQALQRIKACAFLFSGMIILAAITTVIAARIAYPQEDTPPIMMIGSILAFTSLIIAIFVAVLQRLLREAIHMKTENELTV